LGYNGWRLDRRCRVEAGIGVTQQVSVRKREKAAEAVNIGPEKTIPQANKIHAETKYDFAGRNLTAYGGLLPVAALLEKLHFPELVEATVNLELKRQPRSMAPYQFLLGMILAVYVGFARLHHLQYLEREPMLLGILNVGRLPGQPTFWRFLQSLHLSVEQQLANLNSRLRERVWAAANVRLREITMDTDTTVHTLYGKQMGARIGYNPKHRGKPSYQPMLTFFAETREFVAGRLHNGDRPTGAEIAKHLAYAASQLPKTVEKLRARADSGFYCWEAAQCYDGLNCEFVIVARKTPRLVGELQAAAWKRSPGTDADFECQFSYQPEGWDKEFRYVGLRYDQPEPDTKNPDQMGFFEGLACNYRVFVTNIGPEVMTPAEVANFYNKRAAVENLIKESNNDIGLTAHPSGQWAMNANHFQLSMIAYNLNCWLQLLQREEEISTSEMTHRTTATTRLRMLFLAARITRHGGQTEIHFGKHYQEQGCFDRLMSRIRAIRRQVDVYLPVIPVPLRA
jgi:hypothetical protein